MLRLCKDWVVVQFEIKPLFISGSLGSKCRNECKSTSEKMFKECSDELTAQQAFDRLTECNTKADEYSKNCRAECDRKAAATTQGSR